ncbi:hypothetical protein GCM10023082_62880 [Streptomyces tremellae]|uniref:PPE family domain-containing protein n=1 Tax=Streptomyces tremellae TaxID=1124239 RepID=A0ABP7GC86_9ACTN
MGSPGGGKPVPGETDFESMSHAEMVALLRSADARTAAGVSEKLASVAETVSKIGEHLKAHVRALEWEGEGGDAFREWGDQTANATLKLASYAGGAGRWMGHVSQTIVEAHANMPALSVTVGARSDLRDAARALADSGSPGWEKSAMLASSRIESARADAAVQMRRLASSYVQAGTEINKLKPPTFPPPASRLGDRWKDPDPHVSPLGVSGGGVRRSTADGGRLAATVTGGPAGGGVVSRDDSSSVAHATYGGGAHVGPSSFAHNPRTEIDGVTSQTMPRDGQQTLPPPVPDRASRPQPVPSVVLPPFGGTGAGPSGLSSRRSSGTPVGQLPRAGALGGPSDGMAQTGGRSSLPRQSGIIGGRPVESPAGRPPARLPRGTVIGSERADGSSGRQMMGRGVPGTHGGSGGVPDAGRNGLVGGRRLASEPGGVVGRPGQPGRMGARPFTQGGAGLLRQEEAASSQRRGQLDRTGPLPRAGVGARRPVSEGDGERPDYLIEEEETWQQGNRRVVPPVID